jgi:hypothetical protein
VNPREGLRAGGVAPFGLTGVFRNVHGLPLRPSAQNVPNCTRPIARRRGEYSYKVIENIAQGECCHVSSSVRLSNRESLSERLLSENTTCASFEPAPKEFFNNIDAFRDGHTPNWRK